MRERERRERGERERERRERNIERVREQLTTVMKMTKIMTKRKVP